MRIIISGGGSGGHVYPAIAIADALKEKAVEDILFVGASDKMEMEKVPAAGYKIEGLWISGLHRQRIWRNVSFPFKLISSLLKAKKIIEKFKPDVVVGVGGFASGPVLKMAQMKSIPTLIQEQNSYPGITNKLLAKDASKVCVAYPGMERFFDSSKLIYTGNPVRKDLINIEALKAEGIDYFDLDQNKKTVLIFGGSLGARSINDALYHNRSQMQELRDTQFLWQVGKVYYDEFKNSELQQIPNIKVLPFIDRMDLAYAAADVVICRAGALTISEMCIVGKPAVFVPSPNVAEDHQSKNAQSLVENDAAWMVKDSELKEQIPQKAIKLLKDIDAQKRLSVNMRKMAMPDAGNKIAEEIIKLIR